MYLPCSGAGGSKPQSHTAAALARANAESNTQLGSSLNKSGRLTVKSFVSWDQKREVARQGKQVCCFYASHVILVHVNRGIQSFVKKYTIIVHACT